MRDETLFRKLLARAPDRFEPEKRWRGQRVLVTGAAGFIGSSLCRNLSENGASQILALDYSEGNLAQLVRQAAGWPGGSRLKPVLADVRDSRRMSDVLDEFRPALVLHAAAYKHVPLLEHHPFETIENNTLATVTLAKMAQRFKAEAMVLVSTDKAAGPTSIMGASKRLAEKLLALLHVPGSTRFVALRCGNVIGSTGSVLPVWQDQIRAGLSLTVSDKNAERFFLFPEEAANALLLASEFESGLWGYAMHSPVKIESLAERTLELLADGKRLGMTITGLEPGEKLRESQVAADEQLLLTPHSQVARIASPQDASSGCKIARELEAACLTRSLPQLLRVLQELLPAYKASSRLGAAPDGAAKTASPR